MVLLLLALAAADPATAAPPEAAKEPATCDSAPVKRTVTTPLMARFAGRITTSASSTWSGWPSERLVDGDLDTSWFSAEGDAAAFGKKPWVQLRFPEPIVVAKVSLLGNREPDWSTGFSIHFGLLELIDDKGAVLASIKNEERNTSADIDFRLKAPVARVRAVRFTSLMDDGDRTEWRDIALAEVLVE